MPKIAVVLCGCGRGDGSEIHESVSCLIHLARLGAEYRCFAPDAPQADVVNHVTGETVKGESRNQMVEAARISRGEISPLATLDVDVFDAIVFPGGFGAAKNLCSFAKDGAECWVNADAERVIKGFRAAGKPIGMCCIAPVMAARVLGATVTIGDDAGTARAIESMGGRNVVKGVTEAHTDEANRLVTSPAYMYGEASPHEVFVGIGQMIEGVVGLVRA